MTAKLLTRDQFREWTYERDKHRCVLCGTNEGPFDAHHIMDRKLWPDGGYYLDNGVTVCGPCHLKCEDNSILPDEVREKAGIQTVLLPPGLAAGLIYDKWGKLRQKYLKYAKTHYLPNSPGREEGDRTIEQSALDELYAGPIVVTLKCDGENTTMYSDHVHARSIDSRGGPDRDWVKALHASIKHQIPEGWRICGENLYAQHSIRYEALTSYFQVFSVWDGDECLSWPETVDVCEMLGLVTVPVIYAEEPEGWNPESLRWDLEDEAIKVRTPELQGRLPIIYTHLEHPIDIATGTVEHEGFVIRDARRFKLADFSKKLAKWVRQAHIKTDDHWRHRAVTPNKLAR